MKALVYFEEIERIVRAKTGKAVGLANGVGEGSVRVSYILEYKLPFVGKKCSKEVSALLWPVALRGTDLTLRYELATGADLMLRGAKTFFGSAIEGDGLLSWGEGDNQVVLHLGEIARRKGVDLEEYLRYATVTAVDVRQGGLEATVQLNL